MSTLKKKKPGFFGSLLTSKIDPDILLSEMEGLDSLDDSVEATASSKTNEQLKILSLRENSELYQQKEHIPVVDIVNVFFNLSDGNRKEIDLTKVKEIMFKTKMKYSLEIHFKCNADLGEGCYMEETSKLVYKEQIWRYNLPNTYTQREEKYIVKLPQREMMSDRFSKTEVYIRFLNPQKRNLNFICILYNLSESVVKI